MPALATTNNPSVILSLALSYASSLYTREPAMRKEPAMRVGYFFVPLTVLHSAQKCGIMIADGSTIPKLPHGSFT